ncbi:MAG: hypothetical protein ABIK39_06020 [candidate division WOR-3 bacterium]
MELRISQKPKAKKKILHFELFYFILPFALFSIALATKYSGDFEELGTSARALGMGGAVVSASTDPSAIYYNPALCARLPRPSALLMHSEDFSGLVKHNFLGITFPKENQSFGFALLHNGIPGIKLTKLPDTLDTLPSDTNRPYVYRTVNANQLICYFNYSRIISSIFGFGGNGKIIYQNLGGTASCFGMGLDFGVIASPLKDITIGLRVRNLSTAPLLWSTGTKELITPRAAFGVSKLFSLGRDRVQIAFEAEGAFEEKDFNPNIGLEYAFRNLLFARVGVYRQNLSFGLGFRFKRFHIDYGYASGVAPEARELGSPQQISGGVEF